MGDSDASSTAAHSARSGRHSEQYQDRGEGIFRRIFGGLKSDGDAPDDTSTTGSAPLAQPSPSMLNLRNMRVEDVSIPKADIVAVPDTITKQELVQVFRESGMTRLPVYSGTLDTPVGMAHLKDFALRYGFNGSDDEFDLARMLRPLVFVPPSMPIGVLLTKMQTERRHMALVIDEYGGVDGLLTIEDLIEQVIGEIEDEHDIDEGRNFFREGSGSWLALAKTPLEEFEEATGLGLTEGEEINEEEIDTLGGLVFMLAGHVPARGEVVPHPGGFDFEVVDADPRRIKRLRVLPHAMAAGAAGKPAASLPARVALAPPPEDLRG
ncbi:conjugal transfer protein [Salipiger aestuarii]|uniref:CBS domain protein n=1 Tax=Salipiger aestuarii TaxID=568098 RepID=A0A327YQS2_9RHOB|nr:hemolysin family protein [Salipiger aestuarii]EIE49221.1 hemolysin, putative [Citreicella sp. 357]KAA8609744.1 conjugal transfer protein [Salipiger aestuarii]KAA8614075.1 conjugal transfer protein [Salipiger aestuarii]KAB2543630.1 conjugal transfer protein [Salipiger aestuarii]RAK22862.1 CBS domain protein [Salipiger aestuarii]